MSATGPSMDYATFSQTAPSARAALIDMGKAVEASGLDKALTELVKVRVSQINGCGFCLALHLGWAREAAVAQDKLDFLTVWREVDVFSPRERAALAWAEAVTRIQDGADPSPAAAAALRSEFTEQEIIFLTVAVANINAWNRIAGPLRFPLPANTGGKR